jgi:4-hydroxy-3-polyprenylbenzoate decarboxylase
MTTSAPRRLVVGITGASGTIYGVRLLERLRALEIETHLVLSRWGARTLVHETSYSVEQVQRLASASYASTDQGAAISSGSFVTMGMIVLPCSMKTLGAIAHGMGDGLIARAADVVLKERRRLVLGVREAPFHDIHLENMLRLSRMGVIIAPPMPAFYTRPASIDDLVDYSVTRLLDLFGLHDPSAPRWDGQMGVGEPPGSVRV